MSSDAWGGKKKLIDKGDGTSSIKVRANFKPKDLSALEVTSADAKSYCTIFRKGSRLLWTLTNGQHYFESVTFDYGALETDVFLVRGPRSNASGNRISLQFSSPNPEKGEDVMARVLAHEWGHYFYNLPDEYSQASDLGWCADAKYLFKSESCSSFPTSSCPGGVRCVRHKSCVNAGGKYDGYYLDDGGPPWSDAMVEAWGVVSPSQCTEAGGTGPHAVCVLHDPTGEASSPFGGPEFWPNWGAKCELDADCDTAFGSGEGRCTAEMPDPGWAREICDSGTACIMTHHTGKHHWCDADSHVHFDEDGVSLSHNNSLVTRAWANPKMHKPEDYNCWDQAKSVWGGLQFDGEYDDVGLPPNDGDPDFCAWNVPDYTDIEALADWSMVVIDASGSMGADANGTPGWVYAVDGAEYFNQVAVANGRKTGVYAFGGELWPIQWADIVNSKVQDPPPGSHEMVLGEPVDLAPAAVDLYGDGVGAYVESDNYTDLCAVLEGAKASFAKAGAPAGDREVVLLTDAIFTIEGQDGICRGVKGWVHNDPSIAGKICAEAGMRVNVISTGATPNLEWAQWLAESCGGWHFHAGDEQALNGSFPHAAKLAMAVSKAKVAGHGVALHERAPLAASFDSESHSFAVPAGAASLDAAWIGSPFALINAQAAATPAFDSLEFVLKSPSGMLWNPAETDSGLDALYRRISIDAPEPGMWTMRLDTSKLSPNVRSQVDVGWLASVDHPDYQADAWVERPVWSVGDEITILGSMINGEYGVGAIKVGARISAAGQSWNLPMFDDGHHGDELPDDGVYAAQFVAVKVPGPYAVKVDYELIPGTSHTIPGEPIFGSGSGPGPQVIKDSASLVAHTSFAVRRDPVGIVHAKLPPLQAGETHWNLSATIEGRLLPWPGVSVSLGEGVIVRDLELECANCAAAGDDLDPGQTVYELRFNAEVLADAPLTKRDLLVEVGTADYALEGATSVVDHSVEGSKDGDVLEQAAGCGIAETGEPFGRWRQALALAMLMLLGLSLRAAKTR